MSFINYKDHVEDGDTIIAFMGKMIPVHVSKQDILQTKHGAFPHSSLIGKQFGTKVYSKNKKGWIYILHPTPELWTTTLPHRTQILYSTDISMVLLQLNLKPGAIVVESGTGSGSMSHAIIRTIAPSGHLYTFEFHDARAKMARTEFSKHGLADLVTVENKNVIKDGFLLDHVADAVFLDLPSPWDAIKTSKDALKVGGGNLCSFSPCIEQVQQTCNELQIQGFKDIRTMECLLRTYNVKTWTFPEPNFGDSEMLNDEKCNTEQLPRKRAREDDDDGPTAEEGKKQEEKLSLTPNTMKRTCDANPEKTKMLTTRATKKMPGHTGYLTFAILYP